jgi:hypothetical protein
MGNVVAPSVTAFGSYTLLLCLTPFTHCIDDCCTLAFNKHKYSVCSYVLVWDEGVFKEFSLQLCFSMGSKGRKCH